MPARGSQVIWLWTRVVLCLIGIDVVLFRFGLFWKVTPMFGVDTVAGAWSQVYAHARRFEAPPSDSPPTFVFGSSIVFAGVFERPLNGALRAGGVPATAAVLSVFDASVTDAALLAWAGRAQRPRLVIYGTLPRDFPRRGGSDSPVVRVFYDASADLPAVPRPDMESLLAARLKVYWKLYRYRFFVRTELMNVGGTLLAQLTPSMPLAAEPPASAAVPAELAQRFFPSLVTPDRFALWERWRASRAFGDYLAWIRSSPDGESVLWGQEHTDLDYCGPDGNPHVASLEWMLTFLEQRGTRVVVAYFPESPILRQPEASRYYHPELSDAFVQLYAREATAHGARFVDLRDLLDPEDFYDFIHPNLVGARKLTARLADIAVEEWRSMRDASR